MNIRDILTLIIFFGIYSGISFNEIPFIISLIGLVFLLFYEKISRSYLKYIFGTILFFSITSSKYIIENDYYLPVFQNFAFLILVGFLISRYKYIAKHATIIIGVVFLLNFFQLILYYFGVEISQILIDDRNLYSIVRPHFLSSEPSDVAKFVFLVYFIKYYFAYNFNKIDYLLIIATSILIRSPIVLFCFLFFVFDKNFNLYLKSLIIFLCSFAVFYVMGERILSILDGTDQSYLIRISMGFLYLNSLDLNDYSELKLIKSILSKNKC